MKKFWIIIIGTIVGLLLTGCANPFISYYHNETGNIDITKSSAVIVPSLEQKPTLIKGTNVRSDTYKMFEKGYLLIGFSSFNTSNLSPYYQKLAIEQAKKVHASIVYLYGKYIGTVSGYMPISQYHPGQTMIVPSENSGTINLWSPHGYTLGNYSGFSTSYINTPGYTTTKYIPYSINRYDCLATYWIKGKSPILGVVVRNLSSKERKVIQSNKGVVVTIVINNTPAFMADILQGDIIKKIGNIEITTVSVVLKAIEKYEGKKVSIIILRNGQKITKEIQLNKKP
jgi:hypothetical protein